MSIRSIAIGVICTALVSTSGSMAMGSISIGAIATGWIRAIAAGAVRGAATAVTGGAGESTRATAGGVATGCGWMPVVSGFSRTNTIKRIAAASGTSTHGRNHDVRR